MFYFTNKLKANVQKKNLAIAINTYEVVTSEVKKPWRFIKVHFKNLHAQTKFIKPLHIFFSRLLSFGFDWQDKTRPSTCNIR